MDRQHCRINLSAAVGQFEKQTRSEEHTSELQSQSNLVCRLLLEKKKETNTFQWSYVSTFLHLSINLIVCTIFGTLPSSVSYTSFICHSYEYTQSVTSFITVWTC